MLCVLSPGTCFVYLALAHAFCHIVRATGSEAINGSVQDSHRATPLDLLFLISVMQVGQMQKQDMINREHMVRA